MFKFYASQDKKDLTFNMEQSLNTMNMREFIRFSYQQYIIPSLLQPEDIVNIYRQLVREKQEDLTKSIIYSKDRDENYLVDGKF